MSEKLKHPNEGSSLDDFLNEEGILAEATDHALKQVIAWQLKEEMQSQKLTKVEMARRMNTPRSQLDRVLNAEDGNITLDTLQRAAQAIGRSVRIQFI